MQDINFKGKRTDDGKWVHGYLVKTKRGESFIVEPPLFIPAISLPAECFIPVITGSVCLIFNAKDKPTGGKEK